MSVTKYLFNKATALALVFAIGCGSWVCYKAVEPIVYPVVKSFTISYATATPEGILISGFLNKSRACKFIDVVAYSNQRFIPVDFRPAKVTSITSRLPMYQTYGPWLLAGDITKVSIYVTHECNSGVVVTKLFDGNLPLNNGR